MRFLKSISKWLIITFGSISLLTIMGVGAAGIHFKPQVIEYYTKIRDETQKEDNKNIFTNIKGLMNDLETKVNDSKGTIDGLMTSADQQIANLSNIITQLENAVNNQNPIVQTFSSSSTKEDIKKLIQDLKNAKTSLETSVNNIKNDINGPNGAIGTIDNFFRPGGEADTITGYVNTAENIFGKVSNVFAETPPDKFESYYSTITVVLTAVPAAILGIGIIGSITGSIFYKKVDGKLVRRSKAKQDLANHIKKIVKKYPDILSQVK